MTKRTAEVPNPYSIRRATGETRVIQPNPTTTPEEIQEAGQNLMKLYAIIQPLYKPLLIQYFITANLSQDETRDAMNIIHDAVKKTQYHKDWRFAASCIRAVFVMQGSERLRQSHESKFKQTLDTLGLK